MRTSPQNRRFHAMVRDIAKQVKWAGEYLGEEDWKRLLLAGMYGQKVVPNPLGNGFVVMNNKRTRNMPKPKMAEFMNEIEVFGVENGVKWSEL